MRLRLVRQKKSVPKTAPLGASPELRRETVRTANLTVETDPPTESQSREQVLILGGMRAGKNSTKLRRN